MSSFLIDNFIFNGTFRRQMWEQQSRVLRWSVFDARPVDFDIPPVSGLPPCYLVVFTVWMLLC
jgi:hypothetical protein